MFIECLYTRLGIEFSVFCWVEIFLAEFARNFVFSRVRGNRQTIECDELSQRWLHFCGIIQTPVFI